MRYSEAVASAPPGASRFQPEDLLRLDTWALALVLSEAPAAVPPADLRSALSVPDHRLLCERLPPAVRERLADVVPSPDPEAARRRVVGGAFWLLVYELEPELWDALSRAESVPLDLVEALPPAARVVEVAAGTGRLTRLLQPRVDALVAIEPAPGLRALLRGRVPDALVVAAVGQALPVRNGWADLVVSCAAFGPDAPWGGEMILSEMERVAGPGGTVALVGPEQPSWWQDRGFELETFACEPEPMPENLAGIFGPRLQPPRDLLVKRA